MTRINVIPVCELSDQHLIAEYHELPRVLKQDINIADAPEKYCLGKGHVKWAKLHARYCVGRFLDLINEMKYRGFKANCKPWKTTNYSPSEYNRTSEDIEINRQRIKEKYNMKPNWYCWTKRTKPDWL